MMSMDKMKTKFENDQEDRKKKRKMYANQGNEQVSRRESLTEICVEKIMTCNAR